MIVLRDLIARLTFYSDVCLVCLLILAPISGFVSVAHLPPKLVPSCISTSKQWPWLASVKTESWPLFKRIMDADFAELQLL